MKYSKHCENIKDFVTLKKTHPTADEVYFKLKGVNKTLSLGTVYRNLNRLTSDGVLKKLHMPNGSDRFDGNTDEHYHVVCTSCGKIFDVSYSLLFDLDEKVEQSTGVKITGHQLLLNGVCQNCQ